MAAIWSSAQLVLRPDGRGQVTAPRALLLIIICGAFYGALMGMFYGSGQPPRLIQAAYSAFKVPALLGITFTLALPSFYVINALLGLAGDFPEALRALMATQAGLTVILSSLAPFTVLYYVSTTNYDGAILFNAAMFATASITAQRLLKRFYGPLIARNPRHRKLLRVWIIVYAFVGIQMGWVLRPFIGHPDTPTTFFRSGAWGNAYVEVWQKTVDLVKGPGTSTR